MMNVVLLFNGLGNQMSQYAFYLSKKISNPKLVCVYYPSTFDNQHNGYELEKIFDIKLTKNTKYYVAKLVYSLYVYREKQSFLGWFSRKIYRFLQIEIVYENMGFYKFENDKYQYQSKKNTFFWGGWHNEEYFKPIQEMIRNKYQFKIDEIGIDNDMVLGDINSTNSISIHIRRGDYFKPELRNIFGEICTVDYYQNAIKYIDEHLVDPMYYIFTDDKEWVRKNITIKNSVLVDMNNGANSWKDMYLMSRCKHNINANSTFSWWAAWLNPNEEKMVIVPEKFCIQGGADIYPETWIKMPINSML